MDASKSRVAGVVAERVIALDGAELYDIMLAFDDEQSHGMAIGSSMTRMVPGGPFCVECPLWINGKCGLN